VTRQPVHRFHAQRAGSGRSAESSDVGGRGHPGGLVRMPILETLLSILRRLISGRPIFTADREHIHHKLLQMGFSHRQVVIVLYAVSALFAMLSLFLLCRQAAPWGLVLAVVGTGIWLGVQHLNYLEFGETAAGGAEDHRPTLHRHQRSCRAPRGPGTQNGRRFRSIAQRFDCRLR